MTEREMFKVAFRRTKDYKFYKNHDLSDNQIFEIARTKYKIYCVQSAWEVWQASANREGYKLVPVDDNESELERICNVLGDASVEYKATLVAKKAMTGAVE